MNGDDQRIMIDRDNKVTVPGKLPWTNKELKRLYAQPSAVWCDYPRPWFDGDTAWLTNPYEE